MAATAGVGELCSILSAFAWAVGLMFYRQLGARLPPLQLNFLKNLLVLGMLLPAIPLVHGLAVPRFTDMQVLAAIASGVLGIGVADTLYFSALNALGAGRMGVLGNFYSPFVIVLSFAFLGERLLPVQLAGFALVSAGVWVAAWPRKDGHAPLEAVLEAGDGPNAAEDGEHAGRATRAAHAAHAATVAHAAQAAQAAHSEHQRATLRGLALGLLAVVLMAVSVVLAKRVLEAQPLLWVTGWRMLGAIVGMAAIALLRGEGRAMFSGGPAGGPIPWGKLALAAFIGQFLAMILWLAGYKYTLASIAAVLNETASVFILLLAALWLKEPLTRRSVLGVTLTLGGVALMLLAPRGAP